jgi:hypothetical protein
MDEKRSIRTRVSAGSGNVFADLGFAQPEEELTKAQLIEIYLRILERFEKI